MRIVASQIGLAATTSVTRSTSESIRGRSFSGASSNPDVVQVSAQGRANARQVSATQASAAAAQGLAELGSSPDSSRPVAAGSKAVTSTTGGANATDDIDDQELLGSADGAKYVILRRLLEAMTGRKVQLVRAKDLSGTDPAAVASNSANASAEASASSAQRAGSGSGFEFEVQRTHTETTSLDFSAKGTILTEDGKSISFDASFVNQSSTIQVESVSVRGGAAQLKDPLVLLYSGTHAELAEQVQDFDLDVDGKLDQLPSLANGAYVARDVNRNGKIDDGRELLGALSGDGFAELRALDEDGNGFIDSGDSSFDELYLYNPSGAADQQLTSLAQSELLGLYTGSVSTPFELKSNTGELEGRVRNTGIYVTEDGGVRPMEQIDLKV